MLFTEMEIMAKMRDYYFSKLTCQEQDYYRKITESIERGDSIVRFNPFVRGEMLARIANAVNYDHPELFFVDFQHLNFMSDSVSMVYRINYKVKTGLRQAIIDGIEQKIKIIIDTACVQNMKNDYEKCRWIHNYLVKNVSYNYAALKDPDHYPDSFGINGVFKEHRAVCEGISKAFKLLCDRMGVDALIVSGRSSLEGVGTEMPHAWNIVRLEGEYSHVDVTWNISMSRSSQYTRFDYFCMPDKCMRVDHVYEGLPKCTTDRFSYFQKRRRWFSGDRQLQGYLESELKKGETVLYFKAENKKMAVEVLLGKIQTQVSRTVSSFCNGSYCMEMVSNEKQLCFFFKIRRGGG